jgi:ribonuclease P protein component
LDFNKKERLKSNLSVQDLIRNGQTLSSFPLKLYWNKEDDPSQKYPVKMAVSVPKKKIRRAVDRNLLKRRIRESYRQNKCDLYDLLNQSDLKLLIVIMFIADDLTSYERIDSGLKNLFLKLIVNIKKCT